jgi:hypothetical protein
MMNGAEYRRYLIITATLFLVGYAMIVGSNWLIDPYDIHDVPRIEGFNARKPEFANHLRMIKAHAVRLKRPQSVLLGTSRAEFGLDPDHPALTADGSQSYNLGIVGANMYETMRYLQHAHAAGPLVRAVLALDLFAFNIFWKNSKDFSEERLLVTASGKQTSGFGGETLSVLASFDTLRASVRTIQKQEKALEARVYLPNGMADPNHLIQMMQKDGGQRAGFLKSENGFLEMVYLPDDKYIHRFSDPLSGRSTFDYFRNIVTFCRAEGIDLRLFISPAHARQWEILAAAGLWPHWEDWKRKLVSILDDLGKNRPDHPAPHLWDFSGYNSVTTEDVPQADDASSLMRGYLESSHYNAKVGNMVLDTIFGRPSAGEAKLGDFGTILTPENIEEHLAAIRTDRQAYRATHNNDLNDIAELSRKLAKKRGFNTFDEFIAEQERKFKQSYPIQQH